jgi:hypothetical protein
MQDRRRFPNVTVEPMGEGFEATEGVELKSLLKADLFLAGRMTLADKNLPSRLDPRLQHQARRVMLQTISSWPERTTIELRITFIPDLGHNARRRIFVSILISTLPVKLCSKVAKYFVTFSACFPLVRIGNCFGFRISIFGFPVYPGWG